MEIPPERQQVLAVTLTMSTNTSSPRCPPSKSDDRCCCVCMCVCVRVRATSVPVLPRPVLFRVLLTAVKFARPPSACEPSPDRSVYRSLSEEVLCCVTVCVHECVCVYLCEHDPGLGYVQRSGDKRGHCACGRHVHAFSKSVNIKRPPGCSHKSL